MLKQDLNLFKNNNKKMIFGIFHNYFSILELKKD